MRWNFQKNKGTKNLHIKYQIAFNCKLKNDISLQLKAIALLYSIYQSNLGGVFMNKTRNLIIVAMFAALTAIGAFIKVPIPYVPFTLQYLFCALAGLVLGSKLGALSQIVYVAIGLSGVPVFTEGGGIGYIFKPLLDIL